MATVGSYPICAKCGKPITVEIFDNLFCSERCRELKYKLLFNSSHECRKAEYEKARTN